MDKKELSFKDIDVGEIREIAIKHYIDSNPTTSYPQVEATIKAFLKYCHRNELSVVDGKVYKTK